MSRLRHHFTTVRLLLFMGGACLFALPSPTQATQPYLIGRGISDITGPLVGVGLWGFGRPDQIGEGIHTRLRSRAFVIAQADEPDKRLVFASAEERLIGPIETRQIYIDLSNYAVKDRFTGNGLQHTCPSAYGYSFAGGSTEDGGGHFLFREGMTEQQLWRDWLIRLVTGAPKWTEAVKTCRSRNRSCLKPAAATRPCSRKSTPSHWPVLASW